MLYVFVAAAVIIVCANKPVSCHWSAARYYNSAIVCNQLHFPHLMRLWRNGASTLQYEAEEDDEAFDVCI